MVEFREMAKEQAEAARAGDKEAQQKRVYYQGTLETDKANYRPPALASRAGGPPGPMRAIDVFDQLVENHVFVRATRCPADQAERPARCPAS
jgi:hypothetical protein